MSEPSIMEQVRFFTHPKPQSMNVDVAALAKALGEAVEILKNIYKSTASPAAYRTARDFLRKIGTGE